MNCAVPIAIACTALNEQVMDSSAPRSASAPANSRKWCVHPRGDGRRHILITVVDEEMRDSLTSIVDLVQDHSRRHGASPSCRERGPLAATTSPKRSLLRER
jgi:hypothetical protein